MGIFDALNTSVGGLQAQSFALQNISGNIANSSTIGYKGINTSFRGSGPQSATPSRASRRRRHGSIAANAHDGGHCLLLDGRNQHGDQRRRLLLVQKPTSVVDNQPVFDGVTDYTRAGDFQVNANGNLVNGAGYYLMGVPVDPKTGNPLGSVPTDAPVPEQLRAGAVHHAIQYAANLPTTPATSASGTASADTITAVGGLNPSDFATNPLVIGAPAPPVRRQYGTVPLVNNQLATPAPITARHLCRVRLAATCSPRDLPPATPSRSTARPSPSSRQELPVKPAQRHRQCGSAARQDFESSPAVSPPSRRGAITPGHGHHAESEYRQPPGPAHRLPKPRPLLARSALRGADHEDSGRGHQCRHRAWSRQRPDGVHQRIRQRWRGNSLQCGRNAGEPAIALGQDRQPILGAGHQDTWNLFYEITPLRPALKRAWTNVGINFIFNSNGPWSAERFGHHRFPV